MDDWIAAQMATVPDYDVFAGVDSLEGGLAVIAAEFPDLATRRRVGTSRMGSPIHALTVGTGPGEALVFGLPHPNEPVGGLTALHLADRLCRDAELRSRLGLRFTIISCIDPDGLRLNEGWLGGPFTRTHYARHFYRPAGKDQVEWTFPVDYKTNYFDAVLPETSALVRLIDQLRPALMVSLHNSEMGGAYYYLSRPEPALYGLLQAIPESVGLPLDRGEPEGPEILRLADGVFQGLGIKPIYDYLAANGTDVTTFSAGDGSGGYAERYGTLTLFSEVPYWTHPASSDATPVTAGYSDLLLAQGTAIAELGDLLGRILSGIESDLMSAASPFLSACRFFIPSLGKIADVNSRRAKEAENHRPATVAEEFSLLDLVVSFRVRYGGMLLRLLDGELAVGNTRGSIRTAQAELAAEFAAWCAEAAVVEKEATALPIRSLVSTQYGAILACARHLSA